MKFFTLLFVVAVGFQVILFLFNFLMFNIFFIKHICNISITCPFFSLLQEFICNIFSLTSTSILSKPNKISDFWTMLTNHAFIVSLLKRFKNIMDCIIYCFAQKIIGIFQQLSTNQICLEVTKQAICFYFLGCLRPSLERYKRYRRTVLHAYRSGLLFCRNSSYRSI